jgi:hypothetical protein
MGKGSLGHLASVASELQMQGNPWGVAVLI